MAGYFGDWVDDVLMRLLDVTLTLPLLVVIIVVANAFPSLRSAFGVAMLIALSSWMTLSRIVRAEFLSLREREYIEAARALGASGTRIVFKHLIPNSLSQIVVWSTPGPPARYGAEAALSFLGYGVQGSDTSLGVLVAEGAAAAETDPGCSDFPGLALLIIVVSISLIGDGIQDAVDPGRDPHLTRPNCSNALICRDPLDVFQSSSQWRWLPLVVNLIG